MDRGWRMPAFATALIEHDRTEPSRLLALVALGDDEQSTFRGACIVKFGGTTLRRMAALQPFRCPRCTSSAATTTRTMLARRLLPCVIRRCEPVAPSPAITRQCALRYGISSNNAAVRVFGARDALAQACDGIMRLVRRSRVCEPHVRRRKQIVARWVYCGLILPPLICSSHLSTSPRMALSLVAAPTAEDRISMERASMFAFQGSAAAS